MEHKINRTFHPKFEKNIVKLLKQIFIKNSNPHWILLNLLLLLLTFWSRVEKFDLILLIPIIKE